MNVNHTGCHDLSMTTRSRGERGRFRSGLSRPVLLTTTAMLATLFAFPAVAQTAATTITPLNVEADGNGVNIVTGQAKVAVPTLSVPAAPRLTFDLLQNAMPHLIANIAGADYDSMNSSVAVSHSGAASESFDCRAGFACRDIKQSGAFLDAGDVPGGPYSFTQSSTGAVYAFDSPEYDTGFVNQTRKVQYYATSIAFPDGELITLTYDKRSGAGRTLHRLSRMSSNTGYNIDITYRSNDATQAAWGYIAQSSLYKTTEPTTALSRLTYNTNQTITDIHGRVFGCSGCVNAPGAQAEWSYASITLPGEGATYKVVSGASQLPNSSTIPPVVTSVTQDGVGWTYSYGNFRAAALPLKYTYDYLIVSGPEGYSQRYNVAIKSIGQEPRANIITSIVDPISRTTSYTYDANMRPISVTRRAGDSIVVGYDSYGNITSKVKNAKPGSGLAAITESAAIDANACAQNRVLCFRPVSFTDGLNRTTNYAYDSAGRLIQELSPADGAGVRRARYFTYQGGQAPTLIRECGLGTTCGTASEYRTEFTYWGQTALPATDTKVDGTTGERLTTTYTYDSAGRLLSADGPLPGSDDAVYNRYDILGRQVWEIGAKSITNGVRQTSYHTYRDADDKVVTTQIGYVSDPANPTLIEKKRSSITYDGRRNASRVVLSSGSTQTVTDQSFDNRGRSVCTTVRMNAAVFNSLPADACTLSTQGAAGQTCLTRK